MTRKIPRRDALEVYVSEGGYVCVKQGDADEDSIIAIEPSLVPRIVHWIQECAAEIESGVLEDEQDVGELSLLWETYLGAKHRNSWLELLRSRGPSSVDLRPDFQETLEAVEAGVNAEARMIVRRAVEEKKRWDVEQYGESAAAQRCDLADHDREVLGKILAGRTVGLLRYSYTLLSLPAPRAVEAAASIMRLAAIMEATFSLEEYGDRLELLSVLLEGANGPYKASLTDRKALEQLLSNALQEEDRRRREATGEDSRNVN